MEGLGWPSRADRAAEISGNSLTGNDLIQRLTPGETYDADEMSATVGVNASELLPRLTDWEVRGWIERMPGGRYALKGRK